MVTKMDNDFLNCPLWTALITPLTEKGVDVHSLRQLLRAQAQAKNGVLLLGSTGEGSTLSQEDRRAVLRCAQEEQGAYPYMVGITDISLPALLAWVDHLNGLAAVGSYLLALPPYVRPGPAGQYEWLKTILDHSTKPVMLYNHPGRVGVSIDRGVIKDLKDHPRLWALKDATGNGATGGDYLAVAPQLQLFAGDDGALQDYVQAGAVGLVSVCGNILPREMRAYVQALLSHKGADIPVSDFMAFFNAVNAMGPNPVSVKGVMHALGLLPHNILQLPLTANDFNATQMIALKAGMTSLQKAIS